MKNQRQAKILEIISTINVETQEHFYHGGGRIENRHAMIEALVFNFDLQEPANQEEEVYVDQQLELALEFA